MIPALHRGLHRQTRRCLTRLAPLALAVLLLGGCAAHVEHAKALEQLAAGQQLEAVEGLRRASAMEPANHRYRMDYLSQRNGAVQRLVAAGDDDRAAGLAESAAQR